MADFSAHGVGRGIDDNYTRRMADTQGLYVDLELNDDGKLPEDLKILLFQSVREMLFNVVKHANTRSAVVNLRRLDSSLLVTVSDQGSGFDPATAPLASETGRGLGLLGIRERLKYMGGTLEIESNPGQGSRLVMSVPVSRSPGQSQRQKGPELPNEPPIQSAHLDLGRKIRLILADDHMIVRQGIANLLNGEPDFEIVGEAADGKQAVDLAIKMHPDVILMDVSMPKLSGVEAACAIRNSDPAIRIIGLSMFDDLERAQAMREAGAVDYLTKSGAAEELIKAIRKSVKSPIKT